MGNSNKSTPRGAGGSSGRLLDLGNGQQHKKVLLLGCGESGKTTLFNQWKRKAKAGTETPLERKREAENAAEVVKKGFIGLVEAVAEDSELSGQVRDGLLVELRDNLKKFSCFPMNKCLGDLLLEFYKLESIKDFYNDRFAQTAQGRLIRYFISRLDVITAKDFHPTDEDFLHLHSRTTGVVNESFPLGEGHTVTVSDFGGQRSERKKWIHFYRSADCIIFTCDSSDFDQTLFENRDMNRLEEAFNVWNSITEDPDQVDMPTILLFTKVDLLERKFEKLSEKNKDWWKSLPIDLGKDLTETPTVKEYLKRLETKFMDNCDATNVHSFQMNILDISSVDDFFKSVSKIVLELEI